MATLDEYEEIGIRNIQPLVPSPGYVISVSKATMRDIVDVLVVLD